MNLVSPSVVTQRALLRSALALVIVGAATIAIGFATHRQPLAVSPAVDGTLTMGVLGLLLALAAGVPYPRALYLMAPVVIVQLIALLRGGDSIAPVGIELALTGVIGLVLLALHEARGTSNDPATPHERRSP